MGFFSKPMRVETPYEREQREKFEQVKRLAQKHLDHYLASPFTAQCSAILEAEISAGRISYPIRVTYSGIVAGPLGYTKLVTFNDYGYNNFSSGEQIYGFLFALCALLGRDYRVEYGPDVYHDRYEPYIVRKKVQPQYRDI